MSEVIRAIQESDLANILDIEQAAHSHPWPLVQFSKRLDCGRHLHALLLLEGEVCGYYIASQIADEAELLNISISPKWQGNGFGAKLLEHLISSLEPQTREIFLEVRASNLPAISLYEKLGFHQLGCRPNYYPCSKKGREDALLYALSLAESTEFVPEF